MQAITTGTEKQNKWAEDIRQGLRSDVERTVNRAGATLEEFFAMDLPDARITEDILKIDDHRFWIDLAREHSVSEIASDARLTGYGIDKTSYGL